MRETTSLATATVAPRADIVDAMHSKPRRSALFGFASRLFLLAALASSCTTRATEVLVTLDTDAPTDRALTIHVSVSAGGRVSSAVSFTRANIDGGIDLPGSFAVVPNGRDDVPVTLTLDADLAGDMTRPAVSFRRVARFNFLRHTTTALPIFLSVDCANLTTGCSTTDPAHCTVSALCEERGETCGDNGRCVGTEVTPIETDGGLTLPEASFRDTTDIVDAPDVIDVRDVPDVVDATDVPVCDGSGTASDPTNCGPCGLVCPVACSAGQCVTVTSMAGARSSTCAVMSDGTVRCWGDNSGRVLALPSTSMFYTRPTEVPGLADVVQIGIGTDHGCALTATHTVLCWGSNVAGALGDGTTNARTTIAPVAGLRTAVEIAVGSRHTCARLMDGSVVCWGASDLGQVGSMVATNCIVRTADLDAGREENSIPCALSPTAVPGMSAVTQLVSGNNHVCALVSGAVRCWGSNSQSQLGYSPGMSCYAVSTMNDAAMGTSTGCSTSSRAVPGVSGATQIAAGGLHTCAVLADASTFCWGHDDEGQLGDGRLSDRQMAAPVLNGPETIFTLPGAFVAGGFDHTAIVGSAGTVYLFGNGAEGQIGNGSTTSSLTPFLVPGMTDIATATLGSYHTCVRTRSGAMRCWGMNASGQIGNGASGTGVRSLAPVSPMW